jgi:hypothetical protein
MMTVFRRNRSMVGLDVGSSSVKLVHLLHGNAKPQLLSCQEQEIIAGDGGDDKGVVERSCGHIGERGRNGHQTGGISTADGSGIEIVHQMAGR